MKNKLIKINRYSKTLLAFVSLIGIWHAALAELPSDKTAKLYIVSKTAELNKTTGVSIFIDDVKIDHGTTHITADQVTTYNDKNNQIIKAIAIGKDGNIATYETMTDAKKPPLIAKAQIIQYFPQRHYVILIGNAYVVQGGNSVKGPHLEYDLTKQLLITKAANKNSRTEIVIQPNDISGTNKS